MTARRAEAATVEERQENKKNPGGGCEGFRPGVFIFADQWNVLEKHFPQTRIRAKPV